MDQFDESLFFTGKQWDKDAQFYYFNARWYDPETGRFITEDPIKDGLLWYGYCGNNPMGFVDFTGLFPITPKDYLDYYYNNFIKGNTHRDPITALMYNDQVAQHAFKGAFKQIAVDGLASGIYAAERISDATTVISVGALIVGHPEVSAVSETIGGVADVSKLIIEASLAIITADSKSVDEAISTAAELGISMVVGIVLNAHISTVEVHIGRNNLYYQLGRRGALSNRRGFSRKLKQDLAELLGPELAEKGTELVIQQLNDAIAAQSATQESNNSESSSSGSSKDPGTSQNPYYQVQNQ